MCVKVGLEIGYYWWLGCRVVFNGCRVVSLCVKVGLETWYYWWLGCRVVESGFRNMVVLELGVKFMELGV